MHPHAPNPAAQPHLSLNAFSVASLSPEDCNRGGEWPSLLRTLASTDEPRFGRLSAAEKRIDDFGPKRVCRSVSRPLLGVTLGGNSAPCGSALFCFGFAAPWVTVSSFAGPSANAELGTWEPGPLARLRQV